MHLDLFCYNRLPTTGVLPMDPEGLKTVHTASNELSGFKSSETEKHKI
jgi:hypothetical protein